MPRVSFARLCYAVLPILPGVVFTVLLCLGTFVADVVLKRLAHPVAPPFYSQLEFGSPAALADADKPLQRPR